MGIKEVTPKHVAVKEAVFPFAKFAGVDTILGPEMRSTGEVMGIDDHVRDRVRQEPDRRRHEAADGGHGVPLGAGQRQGRRRRASPRASSTSASRSSPPSGTHDVPDQQGARRQARQQGARGTAALVDRSSTAASTWSSTPPPAPQAIKDSFPIRRNALLKGIPYYTTLSAARAAVGAIAELRAGKMTVRSLQEYQNG